MRYFTNSLVGVLLLAASSSASTLQIDFSDNAGSYTGNQSPGHAAGVVSGTTWNTVVGDATSGLLWDDGTAATGVQVDVGNGSPSIDWDGGLSESAFTGSTTPFYDNTMMRDWHYSSNNANLGIRVNGLTAGIYRVFALIREPNQLTRTYDAAIGLNMDALGDPGEVEVTPIGDATGLSTWVDGMNFATTDVSVTGPTDWVTLIVDPTNAKWGTVGGLQIVQVPEPSCLVLSGLGLLGLSARRRRSKR